MQMYPLEELAWAIAREREKEAHRTRPHAEERPQGSLLAGIRALGVIQVTSKLVPPIYHKGSDDRVSGSASTSGRRA